MARYREFRKIDSDMVRSMCIKESYYTRGDVDAYTHLLVDLCDFEKEITMDDLEEKANWGWDRGVADFRKQRSCILNCNKNA